MKIIFKCGELIPQFISKNKFIFYMNEDWNKKQE